MFAEPLSRTLVWPSPYMICFHGAHVGNSRFYLQCEICSAMMLTTLILGLLQATGTLATWTAYQEYVQSHNMKARAHESNRPSLVYSPQRPYKKMHDSPKRHKKCVVKSHNDFKTDDSSYVLKAVEKCNDGGHVVFPEGTTYVIGTALDLTGLKHIDIGVSLSLETVALSSPKAKRKKCFTDTSYFQTFKDMSNSLMIRTTGKPTPSIRPSKMRPPFSSSEVKM
jgi:hypothetical protein